MFVIGIDGGGSKTEFAISTRAGKIDHLISIGEGCNPNVVGPIRSLEVIHQGLQALEQHCEVRKAALIYCAIAGCAGQSRHIPFLQAELSKVNENIYLDGDLLSAFHSLAHGTHGALLIAGTGSAVCIIDKDGKQVFTWSCGYSASDLGYWLIEHYRSSHATLESSLLDYYTTIEKELSLSLLTLSGRALAFGEVLGKLARTMTERVNQGEFLPVLGPVATFAATKWARCVATQGFRFGLDPEESAEIVLSGSFWKWDAMRNQFLELINNMFRIPVIRYDPDIRQVEGSISLAWKQRDSVKSSNEPEGT